MDKSKKGKSAYDAALAYLTPRARTVREVELKLDEGNFSEGEIMQTIDRLKEAGLLDDFKYAAEFVDSRLRAKPVSRYRLEQQLRGHYVDEEAMEAALSNVQDEGELKNAVELVEKYMRQIDKPDPEERKKRVYQRLLSRGFGYETIDHAFDVYNEKYEHGSME